MQPKEAIDDVLDVLIIGAGPCGLAAAARLRERLPDALFTDEEHRRYHWIGKYGNKVALKHVQTGKKTSAKSHRKRHEYNIAVLDAEADDWLGRWKRLFAAFNIEHLRSPMLWHVDPLDRDALLAHAHFLGREEELVEIRNCVGKEMSKHARKKGQKGQKSIGGRQSGKVILNLRERNDYYTPSQPLFLSHCAEVAERYRLGPEEGIVHKEAVQDLKYGVVRGLLPEDREADQQLFTITTDKNTCYARAVVLAVGPGNAPSIPRTPSMPATGPIPQACHSMHITNFPDPLVKRRIAAGVQTNVLIIGGGLTSAQLADLAVRRGVTRVWHIMRGPLRLKHFDVDLDWMGKYRNLQQAAFWNVETDEERMEMIKEARGGGSLTPLFYQARTKGHIKTGRVVMKTNTKLVDAKLVDGCCAGGKGKGGEVDEGKRWEIQTEPAIPDLPHMDFIYLATGIQTDVEQIGFLKGMIREYPVKMVGGFPCVTEDLKWRDDVPLFVTGRLAALQLGPAAPNIGGAKIGAERIALGIEELVRPSGDGDEEDDGEGRRHGYSSGHGNMYSVLG